MKHFSEQVEEEFKKRAEAKKAEEPAEQEASGGSPGTAEVPHPDIPMPVARTPEQMLQDPLLVLEEGATGLAATGMAASGMESASGAHEGASGEDATHNVQVGDEESVKMYRAPSRYCLADPTGTWELVTKGATDRLGACKTVMQGKVDNAESFCNWLAEQAGFKP